MTYQALARKWRPSSFEAMVGQTAAVRALMNALDQGRIHHAYLFTGTRGVGKTSLARIIAKCLNCEAGISSNPCDQCAPCQEIAEGRFVDLIEVDAASRTKVEDTRELLENVPYAPTRGRLKIYLIDEVHMLSAHSFNALLKTLEEPPEHVKFLLATTDPQKLPITVLSRCLQFHLKCLSAEQITARLVAILNAEQINFEHQALQRLAHAATGSMRDALSLLDQTIAYSNHNITTEAVKAMLGVIEENYLYEIIDALATSRADQLMSITQQLAEQATDFANVLEELLSLLLQIAKTQLIPDIESGMWDNEKIQALAQRLTGQDVQLYYQIALIGRKDLPFAPSPKSGLEMILLRMLAFCPVDFIAAAPTPVNIPTEATLKNGLPLSPQPTQYQLTQTPTATLPTIPEQKISVSDWQNILPKLNLTGMSAVIAVNCTLDKMSENAVELLLDPAQAALLNKKYEERLGQALSQYCQRPMKAIISVGKAHMETPAALNEQTNESQAMEIIQNDENVQKIISTFNAKIVKNSLKSSG
jgi:DNA polymerase III subunit gamma/tau